MRRQLGNEHGVLDVTKGKTRFFNSGVAPWNGAAPFLRWVGGKQQLIKELVAHAPSDYPNRPYREPFLGAGSLFFALQPTTAHLSDSNACLIDCYSHLRATPALVYDYLCRHANADSPHYYYRVRDEFNKAASSAAQAARFIYLNRTAFNGIFRVNTKGHFNVPYGHKASPLFPGSQLLKAAAALFSNAILEVADYRVALARSRSGDFIYLDPPYPPLNGTAYFTHYTKERFTATDQETLARIVRSLTAKGCLVMMSNADTPGIRALYRDFHLYPKTARRYVSCKGRKHEVFELIITNY